jgi:CheY-like chemotaxis protein
VRIVADGHEAVEYLQGEGKYGKRDEFPFPKVIISDLKMPRLSGLELLEWLRNHPHCAVIPAILLSGSTLEEDIMKAYELGANTYFRKPASFGELVELLRRLRDYWEQSELPKVAGGC